MGCGCYLDGAWSFLQWPDQWANSGILKDITFLEMVQIGLAVMLWKHHFRGLRIQFCTDNMACLRILNLKSGKSETVMKLVRAIVYGHFSLIAISIHGFNFSQTVGQIQVSSTPCGFRACTSSRGVLETFPC